MKKFYKYILFLLVFICTGCIEYIQSDTMYVYSKEKYSDSKALYHIKYQTKDYTMRQRIFVIADVNEFDVGDKVIIKKCSCNSNE